MYCRYGQPIAEVAPAQPPPPTGVAATSTYGEWVAKNMNLIVLVLVVVVVSQAMGTYELGKGGGLVWSLLAFKLHV